MRVVTLFLPMSNSKHPMSVPRARLALALAVAVLLTGCGLISPKSRVAVAPVLTPLVDIVYGVRPAAVSESESPRPSPATADALAERS